MRLRGTKGKEGEGKVGGRGRPNGNFWAHWPHQARQECGGQTRQPSAGLCRPGLRRSTSQVCCDADGHRGT
jgi:hypothetical protein